MKFKAILVVSSLWMSALVAHADVPDHEIMSSITGASLTATGAAGVGLLAAEMPVGAAIAGVTFVSALAWITWHRNELWDPWDLYREDAHAVLLGEPPSERLVQFYAQFLDTGVKEGGPALDLVRFCAGVLGTP